MADITSTGYKIKTMTEWFDDLTNAYLDIDANWQLDPSTPDGLLIATLSEIYATLDELSQTSYNSKDPSKATGLQLDTLAYLTTGSPRQLGSFSTVTMQVEGDTGTVVDKGTLFESTFDGSQWATSESYIIEDPTVPPSNFIDATCTVRGATAAAIGDITKIISPVAGLDSVSNSTVATIGTDPETDAQLRERRQKSVAISGNNQTDNIFSSIAIVDDVAEVKIYENFSNTTDAATTVPAHSLGIVVRGGDDDAIALAIYSKKNPGCGLASFFTEGTDPSDLSVTKSVTSPVTGNVASITFNRPEPVNIFISCTIRDDGTLPNSTDPKTLPGYNTVINEIKASIISYTSGKTELQNGFKQSGFNVGDDVIQSALFTPINQVLGSYGSAYVTNLEINKQDESALDNIDILFYQIAQFIETNMTITVNLPV